nr:MAG TPA: cysteine-rich protein [Caudoviricetes sp.]
MKYSPTNDERGEKGLRVTSNYGRLDVDKRGWIACPRCGINHHMFRVRPDTTATNIPAYCKKCKTEVLLLHIEGETRALDARVQD